MAINITCAHCGVRPINEWVYGEILDPPSSMSADAVALDRAYFHANPAGPVREAWFHLYGCRRWTRLERDTRTDQIGPNR